MSSTRLNHSADQFSSIATARTVANHNLCNFIPTVVAVDVVIRRWQRESQLVSTSPLGAGSHFSFQV